MADKVLLEVSDSIAVITNNNPDKRNAFDDDMDLLLFDILRELKNRDDVRAVIWRAEGTVWSAGRDLSVVGQNATQLSHHELMTRGHRGILQVF
jgi:enoyl-CoA hydratase/carnithine racemase